LIGDVSDRLHSPQRFQLTQKVENFDPSCPEMWIGWVEMLCFDKLMDGHEFTRIPV
jgi:hypothetical protein